MIKPHKLFFASGGLRCAAELYWPATILCQHLLAPIPEGALVVEGHVAG